MIRRPRPAVDLQPWKRGLSRELSNSLVLDVSASFAVRVKSGYQDDPPLVMIEIFGRRYAARPGALWHGGDVYEIVKDRTARSAVLTIAGSHPHEVYRLSNGGWPLRGPALGSVDAGDVRYVFPWSPPCPG